MRRFAAIFTSVLLVVQNSAWAVRHLHPGTFPHAFNDRVHRPTQAQVHAAGSMHAAVLATATGTKRVAVIIVQFPAGDSSLITGSRLIQNVTDIKNYMTAMAAYYDEASYHKLSVTFSYFNSDNSHVDGDAAPSPSGNGVYTLSHPMEYYGCGDEGVGCAGVTTPSPGVVTANGDWLIHDALVAARTQHVGTPSNTSAGGTFDSVIVVHAGNGNETTTALGDIWSIFYSQEGLTDPTTTIGQAGGGWSEGDVVPETESSGITSSLGVICHEFGHELGLPDEYNTGVGGGASVVGDWEIMDSGPFDGFGANPSHPGAWDRSTLGWASPQTLSSKGSGSLGFVEAAAGNMLKLPIGNGGPQEYFLVEYRSRNSGAAYDKFIPGSGLLVWHIDDAITSTRGVASSNLALANTVNTGQPHYGISIVTADGAAISNSNQGDAGNAFSNDQVFTSPQSNTFSNQPSGITLANIHGVGTSTVGFDVANLAVGPTQEIERVINFPNPAGKGYAHPKGQYTTIQFQLARPATDYEINIYTLSGDLVRKVGKSDMTLNIDRSSDDKWVYEYDWDLKNGDGRMVAPGVYFYLVRADGKSQSAKAVVIR